MKKFIAKLLGMVTLEEFESLKGEMIALELSNESIINNNEGLKRDTLGFKSDMRLLYKEVSSDIKRVDAKIKAVKPILKVEDPEAVAFIKGILKRHDSQITTQATSIQIKMLELNKLETETRMVLEKAKQASSNLNNVLNGLGLSDITDKNEPFQKLRDVIHGKIAL